MKATSKLISVVLILALCLSIFTVSAFADAKVIESNDGGDIIAVFDSEESTESEVTTLPTTTSNGAPEVTKVGPDDNLADAVNKSANIELTGPVSVNGPLTVPAGVTINLGGNKLTINGTGDAAIIASGASFKNGQIAVTGAVTDSETNTTTGFGKVASGGVVFRGIAMTLTGSTELGNVSVVSGTFNKDVSTNIADGSRKAEPETVEGEQAAADVLFVVEEIPAALPSNPPVDLEQKEDVDLEQKEDVDLEQKEDVDLEQKEDVDLEQKEDVDLEQKEDVDLEQKEDVDLEQKADVDVDQKADVDVDQKADVDVDQKADVDVDQKDDADVDQKDDADVDQKEDDDVDQNDDADVDQKDDADSENKDQDASFNNEDPVTIEKPEEKQDVDEVRVDPKSQEAEENAAKTLTATDEVSGAVVTVRGINLPEDVTLVVKHLESSSIGGLADDERAILALDISLVYPDGTEYEPKDDPEVKAVSVTITHPALKELYDEESLVLYHIGDEGAEKVNSADAAEGSDTVNFAADSFSPFVIVASTGAGTAKTGSDGEVHRKTITIKNVTGETYIKNDGDLVFDIYGGAAPESVSIIDPDNVSGGNLAVYQQGYLIMDDGSKQYDYTVSNFDPATGKVVDPTKPVRVTIYAKAVVDAPNGKWAVVFWFRDTANSGDSTRVYMVQYVNIVPQLEIKGVGYNYDEDTKTFEAEKCDYDSIQVLLTADLESFTISSGGTTYAYYNRNESTKKMMVRIDGKDKTVNASEYFTVSDYYATDPLGHEYVAGKSLKIHDTLLKKLPNNTTYRLDVSQSNKQAPIHAASDTFWINLTPGIAVADGLTDYIKGRNTWIKFVACAPIDYDDDGTLAIWIGGQKISHAYYSISNDHQTLWIYRNLLDQLKSNNSYTLTARLWEFTNSNGVKVKTTYYPATASFNILAAGSTSYRSPKTGDESNVALWAAVLVLSGGAVIALVPKKKKGK